MSAPPACTIRISSIVSPSLATPESWNVSTPGRPSSVITSVAPSSTTFRIGTSISCPGSVLSGSSTSRVPMTVTILPALIETTSTLDVSRLLTNTRSLPGPRSTTSSSTSLARSWKPLPPPSAIWMSSSVVAPSGSEISRSSLPPEAVMTRMSLSSAFSPAWISGKSPAVGRPSLIRSLPVPASIVSSPPRPSISSLPSLPSRWSAPGPPNRLSPPPPPYSDAVPAPLYTRKSLPSLPRSSITRVSTPTTGPTSM